MSNLAKTFPSLSIIMVTLNAKQIIGTALAYIEKQDYPSIGEVLIADGGSTDGTIEIAKKSSLPIKIIDGGYKDNQEARRGVGIKKAKNEFVVFIDADNYLLDPSWLRDMVSPLLEHKDLVASQTLRYAVPKNATLLNRYFGLIGGTDPVAYYLGVNDRLSWVYDKWNLRGTVIEDNKKYLIVDFDPKRYPSVGCNGVVFKKSLLLKSDWENPENYMHIDVFVDIAKLGYTRFAIVKNDIFHNTAGDNIFSFLSKRRRYMKTYHQKLNKRRRYLIFDPGNPTDLFRLFLFMFYAFTLIQPILLAIWGYRKKQDVAWFLHPALCLGMGLVYFEATVSNIIKK